jgi:serine/threonine protein kinase/regulator of sirC expression with transglutaminase-like and TPR domain
MVALLQPSEPIVDTFLQNRYQIVRRIGQGGMGAVYEAIDTRLGNVVAIKQTLPILSQDVNPNDDPMRRAFEREARILASLRHPALPVVSDFFAEDDGQFLVMQYIPGEDCWTLLQKRGNPFATSDVIEWADVLLDVLDYLHTRQPPILHRDIKPQNLKLTPRGELVLLDFGLARGGAAMHSLLTTGGSLVAYTPQYAPMEQIRGLKIDARSDLYALAATLYHFLTGSLPASAMDRAAAAMEGRPDPLTPAQHLVPTIPQAVSDILMRTMSPRVEDRPANAAAMRAALRRAYHQTRQMVTTPGPTLPRTAPPPPATLDTVVRQPMQAPKPQTQPKPQPTAQIGLRMRLQPYQRAIQARSQIVRNKIADVVQAQRGAMLMRMKSLQPSITSLRPDIRALRPQLRAWRNATPDWMQRREAIISTLVALIVAIGLTMALPRSSVASPAPSSLATLSEPTIEARVFEAPATTGVGQADQSGYQRAIETLSAAISVQPADPRNYMSRGDAFLATNDYVHALADYSQVLQLKPDAAAYRGRGEVYLRINKYREALFDIGQALQLEPNNARTLTQRGRVYVGLGEYEQAISDYDKALHIDPSNAETYLNRGRAAFYQRSYDRAIADYDQFLRLNPENAIGLYNRGLAYSAHNDQQQAIADFTAYVRQYPNDADAYLYRAMAYHRIGQQDNATADLQHCLELTNDPTLRAQAEQQLRLISQGA